MAEAAVKGTERAAILLLALGEEQAAAVLKHMDAEEVQRLGTAMAAVDDVPREQVSGVLAELLLAVQEKTPLGLGTEEYLRKVLTTSQGERKARGFLQRIYNSRESAGLEALKWMEPQSVAQVIANEHPQIMATILAHLEAGQAAQVLAKLPRETQGDVALRIARLEEVPETALRELDAIVDQQAKEVSTLRAARLGGIRAAADIINLLKPEQESLIMESIQAADSELGERIKESLFVFENLLAIDDRGIQALLREVQSDQLSVALKGADAAIQEKVFRNMSKRAGEILKDDIAAKGPVRLSEVEAAQKEVLTVVQRLVEEGQIVIGGRGEAFV
jgi:flagellar motor switch protein FliG